MNNEEKKEENSRMQINDKRRFNPDGTEKTGNESKTTISSEPEPEEFSRNEIHKELPSISFATLILSLAGSVQSALGIAPDPFTKTVKKDLVQAKQTIDLLGILEEKTKGNLEKEEESLLKVILSDLRVRYIEEKKKE